VGLCPPFTEIGLNNLFRFFLLLVPCLLSWGGGGEGGASFISIAIFYKGTDRPD
jgi:hypothetical protein